MTPEPSRKWRAVGKGGALAMGRSGYLGNAVNSVLKEEKKNIITFANCFWTLQGLCLEEVSLFRRFKNRTWWSSLAFSAVFCSQFGPGLHFADFSGGHHGKCFEYQLKFKIKI